MEKWKQLPEVSLERTNLVKKLIYSCDTIKWQLDELARAVLVAERDMVKFGLKAGEIQSRKSWISSRTFEVGNHRKLLQRADDALRLPMPVPTRLASQGEILSVPVGAVKKNQTQSSRNVHDDYIQDEQNKQTQVFKEQDQDLDELTESVQRMGNIGLAIHDELDSQDVLISDVGRDVDTTTSKLAYTQKKLEHMIKKAGAKGQIILIVVLVILLAVLIMLIFYT
ncbi:hypothetical protein R1sor_018617 [Riccia sorocarpa]|uniref:t-SNARE coiled-coil homology domain-containing protein n=1 Tax=Riccia sorocarpa TaxID=122646 RepID=A0ABD3IDX7_9MARC